MFIADENVHSGIVKSLRNLGIDVVSIGERYSGISDEDVISLAINTSRIIITEDKDFGEWVFAHNMTNISVIFLRYHHQDLSKIISALLSLLKTNPAGLFGKFITITTNKVRTRTIY